MRCARCSTGCATLHGILGGGLLLWRNVRGCRRKGTPVDDIQCRQWWYGSANLRNRLKLRSMKKIVSPSPPKSPGDFVSLPAGDLQQHQHSALRALPHHAMKHPLTKGRPAKIGPSMIDREEIPKLMSLIQAVRSPDHTEAIVGEREYGAFGRATSGSPIVFINRGNDRQADNAAKHLRRNATQRGFSC